MSVRYVLLCLGAVGLLAGCAIDPADQSAADPFNDQLRQGYNKLAAAERAEYDWVDGRFFELKARAAMQDDQVEPEQLANWRIPREKVEEMNAARARLKAALDEGGRAKAPALAARAQVGFDCWVQEQEENWQTADIEACRDDFEDAIAQLEDELAPPSGAATTAASPEVYLVFFGFDSAVLNPVAERVVKQIVIDRLGASPERIEITGNADRSGTATYNERLSARRADAVKKALVDAGIDPAVVVTRADGESMPRVPTEDGVREPQNRNAEIRFVD